MTAGLIALLDTLLSLKSCSNIWSLTRRHGPQETSTIQKKVQDLVMKETFELLLPITYCLVFSISYYGPNAEILGNIKGEFWHYNNSVEDIFLPLSKIGLFLLFDLLRLVLITFVVWKWCKISLISRYCQLMGIYWKPLLIYISLSMVGVSICIYI